MATFRRWSRRTLVTVVTLVVLVVGARIAAPFVIEWRINESLSENPNYTGYVTDVDLFLLVGRITFEQIHVERRGAGDRLPLLEVESLEVDYRWGDLFDGELVADVHVERPRLNLVPAATRERDPKQQTEAADEGVALQLTAEKLFPAKLNELTVARGTVRFRDATSDPPVMIRLSGIRGRATNLNNHPTPGTELPATARATATLQDAAAVELRLRLSPLADDPTFDLNLEMEGLPLTELRDFTRAYADVDMHEGSAELFAEAAAADGKITGYAKPMLVRADVYELGKSDQDDSFLQTIWEAAADGARWVLQSGETDRVAAKVPFEGRFDEPGVGVWSTVTSLIVNAFFEALLAEVDGSITLADVFD